MSDSKRLTLFCVLSLLSLLLEPPQAYGVSPFSGLKLSNSQNPPGAKVFAIKEDSPASQSDLRTNDVITSIGGHAVSSIDDFARVSQWLKDKESVSISVNRWGRVVEVVLDKKSVVEQAKPETRVQAEPPQKQAEPKTVQKGFENPVVPNATGITYRRGQYPSEGNNTHPGIKAWTCAGLSLSGLFFAIPLGLYVKNLIISKRKGKKIFPRKVYPVSLRGLLFIFLGIFGILIGIGSSADGNGYSGAIFCLAGVGFINFCILRMTTPPRHPKNMDGPLVTVGDFFFIFYLFALLQGTLKKANEHYQSAVKLYKDAENTIRGTGNQSLIEELGRIYQELTSEGLKSRLQKRKWKDFHDTLNLIEEKLRDLIISEEEKVYRLRDDAEQLFNEIVNLINSVNSPALRNGLRLQLDEVMVAKSSIETHIKNKEWDKFRRCINTIIVELERLKEDAMEYKEYREKKYAQEEQEKRYSEEVINAYKTLGLDPGATKAEIEKAFNKLAHENHPDKAQTTSKKETKEKTKKMAELNAAHKILREK